MLMKGHLLLLFGAVAAARGLRLLRRGGGLCMHPKESDSACAKEEDEKRSQEGFSTSCEVLSLGLAGTTNDGRG
jgi:hypothetical protein